MSERTKLCANCGKEFSKDARYSFAYWERQKYCSQSCAGAHNSDRISKRRPSMRDKFETCVDKSGDCWIWQWMLDKDGYGLFAYNGKQYRAHALALQFDGRPATTERPFACHTCDNPACVNPAHLYPGTPLDNMRDAKDRGRMPIGAECHMAKLTDGDVRAIRSATGTHAEIAARFGVSPSNVTMIRRRKTWKHVA